MSVFFNLGKKKWGAFVYFIIFILNENNILILYAKTFISRNDASFFFHSFLIANESFLIFINKSKINNSR